jgi:hypothetical protein
MAGTSPAKTEWGTVFAFALFILAMMTEWSQLSPSS